MPRWDSFSQFLQEVNQLDNDVSRQQLVNELLRERPRWPWVEGTSATFIHQNKDAESLAINLDIIEKDPPFDPMEKLEGTDLWFITRRFQPDDLLDYLVVVDDPMTPLRNDPNLPSRIARWKPDDLNPNVVSNGTLAGECSQYAASTPLPELGSNGKCAKRYHP